MAKVSVVPGIMTRVTIRIKLFVAQVTHSLRFLYAWFFIAHNKSQAADGAFLDRVYQVYLHRKPDDDGRRTYLALLRNNHLSRLGVLRGIMHSTEFYQRAIFVRLPAEALHAARVALVQHHIPPAQEIVDLGGASVHDARGALLLMGYPYTPRQITIVDLPVAERLGQWDATAEPGAFVTPEGVQIRYLYRSLADLAPIPDASVDLVYSGESIEHVRETDADRAIQEAWRVLKSGGYLCLDTPNRALTVLHAPTGWTHPEHQKEYFVHELVDKVERQGFVITAAKSICPLPQSLAHGAIDWREMVHNSWVGEKPEEGYLFFLQCRKI